MIDNTHVVVLRGSGRDMIPVPEMAAFGERVAFSGCRGPGDNKYPSLSKAWERVFSDMK
jgi:hypothetical protein